MVDLLPKKKRRPGRPLSSNEPRINLRIPLNDKFLLDEVLQARSIPTYSQWLRMKLKEDRDAIQQERLAGQPQLPWMHVHEIQTELKNRGIALDEASALLADDRELQRLGLYDRKSMIKEWVHLSQESRAMAETQAELEHRGIATTEIPELLKDLTMLRRMGLLTNKEHLERLANGLELH